MSETDRRIQSPELAHHMAHAEYPYRELAAHAMKLGMREAYDEAITKGEKESLKTGRDYIESLHDNLYHYEDVSRVQDDKIDDSPESSEVITTAPITKGALLQFAEVKARRRDGEEGRADTNRAGRVWASLINYYNGKMTGELPIAFRTELKVVTTRTRRRRPVYDYREEATNPIYPGQEWEEPQSWDFESIAQLADEYRNYRSTHSASQSRKALGSTFSDLSMDYFQEFVTYQRALQNKTEE